MVSKQMSFRIKFAYLREMPIRARTVSFAGSHEPREPTTIVSTWPPILPSEKLDDRKLVDLVLSCGNKRLIAVLKGDGEIYDEYFHWTSYAEPNPGLKS
ncbi:hypothetical protein NPIL_112731 [Nephila pilipes]|uniref:Uncharacterized protein n=1 Tax=Nephila pilipes TaxID=299642 RepID=A0A8X6TA20_NEPPI|nr:hypothetical protein NPIL_112731 [Nephila pilipes]